MNREFLITALLALAVFAVGAGIGRIDTRPTATPVAAPLPVLREDGTLMPVLPEVVVEAEIPAPELADEGSVMLDAVVERTGTVLREGVSQGARRAGIAIPYYAFGDASPRSSE